jgi:hypothetical protein
MGEVWTSFFDINEVTETPHLESIWINAPKADAIEIFKLWFNVDPIYVGDGEKYAIYEHRGTLEEVTRLDRGCMMDMQTGEFLEKPSTTNPFEHYMTLQEYIDRNDVEVVDVTFGGDIS